MEGDKIWERETGEEMFGGMEAESGGGRMWWQMTCKASDQRCFSGSTSSSASYFSLLILHVLILCAGVKTAQVLVLF